MALHDNILDDEFEKERPLETLVAAGFWQRVGAVIVDGFVIIGITTVFSIGIGGTLSYVLSLLVAIVGLLYRPVMEYHYGATLGKMLIKIKVITTSGERMDVKETILRNSLYIAGDALTLFSGVYFFNSLELGDFSLQGILKNLHSLVNLSVFVSCLFVAFRENGQALHDSLAGTYVVNR